MFVLLKLKSYQVWNIIGIFNKDSKTCYYIIFYHKQISFVREGKRCNIMLTINAKVNIRIH